MVQQDLGQATIVYEKPDEETAEKTVKNEHIAYFQDHWMIKTGEDERGNDVIHRVPHNRVYHVERSVQQFEEEIKTVRHQVQSFADELKSKLMGGGSSKQQRGGRSGGRSGSEIGGSTGGQSGGSVGGQSGGSVGGQSGGSTGGQSGGSTGGQGSESTGGQDEPSRIDIEDGESPTKEQ